MRLIDTHCHFDDPVFEPNREKILLEMTEVGVSDVVFPAISAATWLRLKSVTDTSAQYHASYGLHPMFLEQHHDEHLTQLKQWLAQERPVAVGECGLDFFVPSLDKQKQVDIFTQHLVLARDFDLPVIIHARKSLDIVLKHIRQIGSLTGVIHSFSGSQQQADQLVEQGFCLGVGGTLTYERAKRLHKVIANVPETHLLLETDAPDQPDSEWQGKVNVPTRLPVIAEKLADLREASREHIAAVTTRNAMRLFGLS